MRLLKMLINKQLLIVFFICLCVITRCYENHTSELIKIAKKTGYKKESLDLFKKKIELFNNTITLEEKYNILSRKDIWFLNYLYNSSEKNITQLYHLNLNNKVNKKNIKERFKLDLSFYGIYVKDYMDNMTIIQLLAIKSFIKQ